MNIYYNIYNNIINNYKEKKEEKNYEILMNINNIYDYSKIIIKDIDEIINENKIENKIKYLYNIYSKMTTRNEIIIKYKIGNENKIRIFGDTFVKNNKSNFQMIINGKNYKLDSFYKIKKENEILEIKLKQIRNVNNFGYMFSECFSLTELPDISKLNTDNVTNMEFMFNKCRSLSSLPDISKWNTDNVTNMKAMFQLCSSLTKLPDIR